MFKVAIAAAPSMGKTTLAQGLASHYNEIGEYKRVDLITEYAREFVGKFRQTDPSDQCVITLEQLRKEDLAKDAEIMITDSPVWLGIIYSLHHSCFDDPKQVFYMKKIYDILLQEIHTYDCVIYLPYVQKTDADDGQRIHTDPKELKTLDRKIQGFMDLYGIDYTVVEGLAKNTKANAINTIEAIMEERNK